MGFVLGLGGAPNVKIKKSELKLDPSHQRLLLKSVNIIIAFKSKKCQPTRTNHLKSIYSLTNHIVFELLKCTIPYAGTEDTKVN